MRRSVSPFLPRLPNVLVLPICFLLPKSTVLLVQPPHPPSTPTYHSKAMPCGGLEAIFALTGADGDLTRRRSRAGGRIWSRRIPPLRPPRSRPPSPIKGSAPALTPPPPPPPPSRILPTTQPSAGMFPWLTLAGWDPAWPGEAGVNIAKGLGSGNRIWRWRWQE